MSTIKDKSDNILSIGSTVEVGAPLDDELHQHEFTGTIESFRNGNVVVEDMEGNQFEVSPNNVVLY